MAARSFCFPWVIGHGKEQTMDTRTATQELTEISCAPECGFSVRSHDEEEAITLAKEHVDSKHPGMKLTREDLKAREKKI